MSNMVPYNQDKKLPAHLQAGKTADAALDSLTSGLSQMGGFPVLSIRGSKWRIKLEGEETPLLDKNKDPIPSLNFVILGANQGLAKNYYDKPYVEGSDESPTCWSLNGDEPDPQVENPVAPKCQRCPMNVWGSKITPQGTKTRACSDSKRLAVIMAMDLSLDEPRIGPALLRVPPASLAKGSGSLRSLMKEVTSLNVRLPGVIVRASFDLMSDYPKIRFSVAGFLGEDLFEKALQWADDDIVGRITGSMEEAFDNEPKEEDDLGEETSPVEQEAAADLDEDVLALGGLGETQEEEDEKEEESAPPPKPVQRKKRAAKKAAAKKAVAKKQEPDTDESGFEDSKEEEDPFAAAIDDLASIFN